MHEKLKFGGRQNAFTTVGQVEAYIMLEPGASGIVEELVKRFFSTRRAQILIRQAGGDFRRYLDAYGFSIGPCSQGGGGPRVRCRFQPGGDFVSNVDKHVLHVGLGQLLDPRTKANLSLDQKSATAAHKPQLGSQCARRTLGEVVAHLEGISDFVFGGTAGFIEPFPSRFERGVKARRPVGSDMKRIILLTDQVEPIIAEELQQFDPLRTNSFYNVRMGAARPPYRLAAQ